MRLLLALALTLSDYRPTPSASSSSTRTAPAPAAPTRWRCWSCCNPRRPKSSASPWSAATRGSPKRCSTRCACWSSSTTPTSPSSPARSFRSSAPRPSPTPKNPSSAASPGTAPGETSPRTPAASRITAFVLPPLAEGEPTTKPLDEDAAHFLIRQVRAHPHQVTIYAAGPLTNIALAISIDPSSPRSPRASSSWAAASPRRPTTPSSPTPAPRVQLLVRPRGRAHHPARPWPRIDLTDVDISVKTHFTKRCYARSPKSKTPPPSTSPSTPASSTTCGTSSPPPRGSTRRSSPKSSSSTWTRHHARPALRRHPHLDRRSKPTPQREMQPVHVQQELDTARF
jgi:hypothetical protein